MNTELRCDGGPKDSGKQSSKNIASTYGHKAAAGSTGCMSSAQFAVEGLKTRQSRSSRVKNSFNPGETQLRSGFY